MNTREILDRYEQSKNILSKLINHLNTQALNDQIVGDKKTLIHEYLNLFVEIEACLAQLPDMLGMRDVLYARIMTYQLVQEHTFPVLKSKLIAIRLTGNISPSDYTTYMDSKISHIKKLLQDGIKN